MSTLAIFRGVTRLVLNGATEKHHYENLQVLPFSLSKEILEALRVKWPFPAIRPPLSICLAIQSFREGTIDGKANAVIFLPYSEVAEGQRCAWPQSGKFKLQVSRRES